jgi:hypothetical protein
VPVRTSDREGISVLSALGDDVVTALE